MAGGSLSGPPVMGEVARRTAAAREHEARFAARAARAVMRRFSGLDQVAMLDLLGLLPEDYPRDELSRPLVEATSASLDPTAWFHGTLAPCSGLIASLRRDDNDPATHPDRSPAT